MLSLSLRVPLHFGAMGPSSENTQSSQANDDAQLMLAYRAGDMKAFDTLYARHRKPLYQYITRLAGSSMSQGECDEVFQDVWTRVIDARERYEPSAQFRTWLFTIAHHRTMDLFRARKPNMQLVRSDDDDDTLAELAASRTNEPQVQVESRRQGVAILQALDQLPSAQREAFLMYEEAGLSVQEIADATGTSFEAAKSRLRYAFAKLREQLSGHR
jgi:RNA polymerase sigma-70 factor, ECF subfamily